MWTVRAITADDAELFRNRIEQGFGRDLEDDDESARRFAEIFDYERTLAVLDGHDIVGTGSVFSMGVTVPGGNEVPMGGVTVITVRPTHRRRGVLSALMAAHLDDMSSRGEPLAGLWASEGGIYGRFGYAPSTFRHRARIDRGRRPVEVQGSTIGQIRLVDRDVAEPIVRKLYEAARGSRAGMLTRSEPWWTRRIFADIESWRGGKSSLRYAIHELDGEPDGFAMYRQKEAWEESSPRGEVSIDELIALTPAGHQALWSFLTNIDLFPKIEYWNLPVDDPLPLSLGDVRWARMTVTDGLWVRLVDVPAALTARTYEHDGELTLAVRDEGREPGNGTFQLEVAEGRATCRRVDTAPDVEIDLDVLGHLYLGGGNALSMAAAGRLGGDQAAVRRLHRLFRTDLAPWCPEVF